ncbi:MAG: thiamine pyrophosphate-binding protein, partial [Clostridiales bacterium]|nr:thiamine pyrophosphate-binding protein [Clostridiales bacterium]
QSDNPLFFGMIGMHGTKSANVAVKDCDVLFLVGARVGDRAIRTPISLEKSTKIIHIDIDPAEIGKNVSADIPLVGDAKLVLNQMLELAKPLEHDKWIEHLNGLVKKPVYAEAKEGTINPKKFIAELSEAMPNDTTVVADVGQNQIWTAASFKIKNGRFLTSGGMGTMGYSIPAAVGAKIADPSKQVVSICGDGSFQMSFMELATAIQHGVKVKFVVMTNNYLGMVRELQQNNYHNRLVAVSLDGSPDFIAVAKAYGIPCMRVTNEEEAKVAIEKLSTSDESFFVECYVDELATTL